jgi:hypothetical protein
VRFASLLKEEYLNYILTLPYLPLNKGTALHNFVVPSWQNCPNPISRKTKGIPKTTLIQAYTTKKVPAEHKKRG